MSSGAGHILEQYRAGERPPVLGPFTHIEAIGLVSIHEKLLTALTDLVKVPTCSGVELLQAKLTAHHNAHVIIKLAKNEGSMVDGAQHAGFRAATPICGNCSRRARNQVEQNGFTCDQYGWPVQPSGTCNSHAFLPTVAKLIPLGAAA
jgi:hypothetical protein